MTTELKAINLKKNFGSKSVVRDVSLEIRQGEIMGLLGPNGAGKTTTFYMLTGILQASAGKVLLNNQDITAWPLYQRARVGLAYLPQESSIFKDLTVWENLLIIAEYMGIKKEEQIKRVEKLLDEFSISHLVKSKASFLSGGERRRLEIARSLLQNPTFVLLDEPFAGIDPLAVGDIQILIQNLKNRGMGVLISDHNVRETLSICDKASLMFEGNLILTGTPDDIINNEKARSVYLGEDFKLL